MASIRLPKELEEKLDSLSASEHATKSDIIREAVEEYISNYDRKLHAYDIGKDLFGRYGSKSGNLSSNFKAKVKEKIHAKISH
jgi:predicted DNA-binding protein